MDNLDKQVVELVKKIISYKGMIAIATIGIWILVLQNLGIIPISQNVNVENTVEVEGKVNARVFGDVNVGNTVDVNLSAINGYSNCFYNSYSKHPKQYYRIPVVDY